MKLTRGSLGLSVALAVSTTVIGIFEGRSYMAYLDPVGIPTICDGITEGVSMGDVASAKECDDKLQEEIQKRSDIVSNLVKVPLKPTQHAALVSFVYNVGEANFKNSTLLRKLNAGDYEGACNELPRWIYAKGKKLGGLVIRRQHEKELCLL